MSFLFGGGNSKEITKNDVDQIFSVVQGIEDSQVSKIVTNLTFDDTDIHGYYKLNILDFFSKQYANIRPRNFEITVNNYNENLVENIDIYYLHTPIKDSDLDYNKLSEFSNHIQFTKKTTIKNPQPYLTFCQLNDDGEIVDVDISQTTNFNLLPDRDIFMSLGALIFQINRKTSGKITLELTINLNYSIKKY